jgi:hypothetical protein
MILVGSAFYKFFVYFELFLPVCVPSTCSLLVSISSYLLSCDFLLFGLVFCHVLSICCSELSIFGSSSVLNLGNIFD